MTNNLEIKTKRGRNHIKLEKGKISMMI
jgi:hypothetical protein